MFMFMFMFMQAHILVVSLTIQDIQLKTIKNSQKKS